MLSSKLWRWVFVIDINMDEMFQESERLEKEPATDGFRGDDATRGVRDTK